MRVFTALCATVVLSACAHEPPPDPLDAFAERDIHARWSIATVESVQSVDGARSEQVSLVIDGQVIDARHATHCEVRAGWVGDDRPLSAVHCTTADGEANIGAFRDGADVVVRVQAWKRDAPLALPQVEEVGRITLSARGKLVFDP